MLLIALSVACVGGAGYLGYRTFFGTESYTKNLKNAEAAYDRGLAAYQGKNWTDAATRFDEARLLADRAREALDTQVVEGKISVDDAKPDMGRILWVKARSIRDRAYAKAHADGKPLFEPTDAQYGNEPFRTYFSIPSGDNGDTRDRDEAIASLRGAADLIPDNPDVIKEALRVELLLSPIRWQLTEQLLRKSIQLNPKDPRSQYFLARFEYDQPSGDSDFPHPDQRNLRGWRDVMAKKSAERMTKAKEHLEIARQNGAHYWRCAGLDAEILYWKVATGPARKVKSEVTDVAASELDAMLFTPNTGAIAVAGRGEHLAGMGRGDALGLSWVLGIGIDRAIAYAMQPNGRPDRIVQVARAALDISDKAAGDPGLRVFMPELLSQTVEVLAQSQRFLTRSDRAEWPGLVAQMEALIKKAPDAVKDRPMILWHLANITRQDAMIAAKMETQTPDLPEIQKFIDRAIKQAEEGLKIAESTNAAPEVIDNFHIFLAEWKLLGGVRSEIIEPHLVRLRTSASPNSRAMATYFEAVGLDRQGKLEKSRKLIEPLTAEKMHPAITMKANLLVLKLSMLLKDPSRALKALQDLEPMMEQVERLTPEERIWMEEAVRDTDELLGLQIRAHLGIALLAAKKFQKENPGKPIPADLLTRHEAAAEAVLKKLRPKTKGSLMGQLSLIDYLVDMGRRDAAEARLTGLAADFPESVEVLRMRANVLAMSRDPKTPGPDANGVAAADVMIQKFIKDFPTIKAGRLFYALWLMQTTRHEKAIAYLKDPNNFPGGGGEAVGRLLAGALLQAGQRDEAQKILSTLPPSQAVDLSIIESLVMQGGDANSQMSTALARHENQGRFRLLQGRMRLAEGKHEEAIRALQSATEFTQAGPAAKALLPYAVLAYADTDPAKGREKAIQLTTELPNEAGLYLAAALAALWMEDVGAADDRWEQTKSMYAGINKWEAVSLAAGAKKADTMLTRVAFRLMAGDIDGARRDAAANLALNPNHLPTLHMLADLALVAPVDTARARELYDAIAKEDAKYPRLPLLDAQIKAANGEWNAAAEVYERLIKETPTNGTAHAALVKAREAGKQLDAALAAARAWQKALPENQQAVIELIRMLSLTGNKPEALKIADQFVADRVAAVRKLAPTIKPAPTPAEIEKAVDLARGTALLVTASGFFRANVFDEAENRLREVRKTFPTSERPALMLGDVSIVKKDWATAEAIYRELLKQNPQNFVAGNNLAWILSEIKNKPEEALVLVESMRRPRAGGRAIGAERLPADFLDTIGAVYVKLNRTEKFPEMQVLFENAIRRYSMDPRMFMYLAHAQAAMGERTRAMENYRIAIRLASGKNTITEEQSKTTLKSSEEALKKLGG